MSEIQSQRNIIFFLKYLEHMQDIFEVLESTNMVKITHGKNL